MLRQRLTGTWCQGKFRLLLNRKDMCKTSYPGLEGEEGVYMEAKARLKDRWGQGKGRLTKSERYTTLCKVESDTAADRFIY